MINADRVAAVTFNRQSTAPAIDQIVGAAVDFDIPVAASAQLCQRARSTGLVDDAIAHLADVIAA